MVTVFLLLMLLFPRCAMGDDTTLEGNAHGTRIITGAELRQAGVIRLSDILLQIDEWDTWTADGYRWQASASGLSGYQGQNWLLMVDGQRMDLNLLGSQNINMLPVTTDLIEYVEVISEPGIYEGFFVEKGMLHIHTIKPAMGGSLRFRYTVGNETGDPGPCKYTADSTSNIDKIGPDNSVSLSLKRDSFWARVNYKYENHASTDPAIEERSRYYTWEDRQARMVMPSLEVETDALPGRHRLYAGGALSGRHTDIFTIPPKSFSRNDLLFLDQNADEIPVRSRYFHGGVNGAVPVGSDTEWSYRMVWSSHNMKSPPNRTTPDPALTMSLFSVHSEFCHHKGTAAYSVGGGLDRRHAETDYALTDRALSLGSVHCCAAFPVGGQIMQKTGMNVVCLDGQNAVKVHSNTILKLNGKHDLGLSISASQRLFGEDSGVWFWRDRGYRFFDDEGGDIRVNGGFDTSRALTSRLTWHSRPAKSVETTAAFLYRAFDELYLAKMDYSYDSSGHFLESDTVVKTDAGGQTYGMEFRGSHNPCAAFSQSVYVRYRLGLSGDRYFRCEQETLPDYRLSYTAKTSLPHNISVHGRITLVSSTTWDDFSAVSIESGGKYPARLSEQVVTDITIEKWFARRKVRTMLQLRNLFNHRVQYYPAGALFDMGIYLQVEMLLDSLLQL